MKRAFLTDLAESDLTKIWVYIAQDKPEAADRFIDRLRAECEKLANFPDLEDCDRNSRRVFSAFRRVAI